MAEQTIKELRAELLEAIDGVKSDLQKKFESLDVGTTIDAKLVEFQKTIEGKIKEEIELGDEAFSLMETSITSLKEDIDRIPKPEAAKEEMPPIEKVEEEITIGSSNYIIKLAQWLDKKEVVIASELIKDKAALKAQFEKYPSLFIKQ